MDIYTKADKKDGAAKAGGRKHVEVEHLNKDISHVETK